MKTNRVFLNNLLFLGILIGSFLLYPPSVAQALSEKLAQTEAHSELAYIIEGNVWLMSADGTNKRQLTFDDGYNNLTWAPDGQSLVLTKKNESWKTHTLFFKDLTEDPPQKIADNVYSFAWDLTGTRIAYSTDQIHIKDIKSSEEEIIIPKDVPGGKHIPVGYELEFLFWNLWGDKLIYYSEGIDGIHEVQLSTFTDTQIFSPSATDRLGGIIAQLQYDPFSGYFFGWDHSEHNYGIPLLISPSGGLTILDEYGDNIIWGSPTDADWSFDRHHLVYGADGGSLFSVSIDPFTINALPGNGMNPRWSPSGQTIAFVTEKGSLKLLDLGTQQETTLLPEVSDSYLSPICGFEGCSDYYSVTAENAASWSVDERHIILPFEIGFFIYDLQSNQYLKVDNAISPSWQPVAMSASVEPVADLKVRPADFTEDSFTTRPFPIWLTWSITNKIEEPKNQIDEFEVRMSEAPLHDFNWNQAQIFEEHVKPGSNGTVDVIRSLPEESLNKNLYFGVKAKNLDGQWSAISNVVEYIDSGFRPNINGYQFSSGIDDWGTYPRDEITLDDFTEADFYQMFKNYASAICIPNTDNGQNCTLRQNYRRWVTNTNRSISEIGRCFGMAATSAMIYDNVSFNEKPSLMSSWPTPITELYDDQINLKVMGVRKFITYYHLQQAFSAVYDYQLQARDEIPEETIGNIREAILKDRIDILILGKETGTHAVVPIAISNESDGKTVIYTYDSASENNTVSKIQVYQDGKWIYSTQENEHPEWALYSMPTSVLLEDPPPPMLQPSRLIFQLGGSYGNIVLTDSQSRQIGVVNGNFVNEIPGSTVIPILDGDEFGNAEPIYLLPADQQYTIQLANPSGDTNPVAIHQFGADYAVVVDNIHLSQMSRDTIGISSNGRKVSYLAQETHQLSVTMTAEVGNASDSYHFSNMRIEAGSELILERDDAGNNIVIRLASSEPFDFEISRLSSTGEETFSHQDIRFEEAKSVAINVGDWNGSGALLAQIDYDGDGQFDRTEKIGNQNGLLGIIASPTSTKLAFCSIGFLVIMFGVLRLTFLKRKSNQ